MDEFKDFASGIADRVSDAASDVVSNAGPMFEQGIETYSTGVGAGLGVAGGSTIGSIAGSVFGPAGMVAGGAIGGAVGGAFGASEGYQFGQEHASGIANGIYTGISGIAGGIAGAVGLGVDQVNVLKTLTLLSNAYKEICLVVSGELLKLDRQLRILWNGDDDLAFRRKLVSKSKTLLASCKFELQKVQERVLDFEADWLANIRKTSLMFGSEESTHKANKSVAITANDNISDAVRNTQEGVLGFSNEQNGRRIVEAVKQYSDTVYRKVMSIFAEIGSNRVVRLAFQGGGQERALTKMMNNVSAILADLTTCIRDVYNLLQQAVEEKKTTSTTLSGKIEATKFENAEMANSMKGGSSSAAGSSTGAVAGTVAQAENHLEHTGNYQNQIVDNINQ